MQGPKEEKGVHWEPVRSGGGRGQGQGRAGLRGEEPALGGQGAEPEPQKARRVSEGDWTQVPSPGRQSQVLRGLEDTQQQVWVYSECRSTHDICPVPAVHAAVTLPAAVSHLSFKSPTAASKGSASQQYKFKIESLEEAREKEGEREGLSQQPGLIYVKLLWPQALLRLRELQGNQLSTSHVHKGRYFPQVWPVGMWRDVPEHATGRGLAVRDWEK